MVRALAEEAGRSRGLPHQAHGAVRGARARGPAPARRLHAGELAARAGRDRLHRQGRAREVRDGRPGVRRGGEAERVLLILQFAGELTG